MDKKLNNNPLNEAWRRWAADNKPQNEEAFYKCFTDAWAMAATEYLARFEKMLPKRRMKEGYGNDC